MKLIELHILQSFPVSCLNRDDVGAPKSAVFGGVPRARISSQSLKRAVHLHARDELGAKGFEGIRSRLLKAPFIKALESNGVTDDVEAKADAICAVFSKEDSKDKLQVTTAVYLSPAEIDGIAKAVAAGEDPKKAAKKAQRNDAADIALFGRMIANDATLNVEGAAMFSHSLSTHKVANDIDFFSAVDDRKADSEDAGAGMIGTLEFNSACYYRFTALNLGMLADEKHLAGLSLDERKAVVDAFIRATLLAVPGARKNSMNAHTVPSYVLGVVKEKGQPVQLVNAFEKPIFQNGRGIVDTSIAALTDTQEKMKTTWGVTCAEEVAIPDVTLDQFCERMVAHVS
ncbi:MAG: type I-E CRISPR-associated protein Cas7/Cse4/CasC [Verrucomicrobiae bacterium]|nr:type I-E CRISPR-associated protein Cas7/Cse4/CasC [Verrucomicrobiae bacterium]